MIAYKFNIFALYLRPHEIYTLGQNSVTHRVLRTSEIAHNCAVHPHLEVCQFSTRFCARKTGVVRCARVQLLYKRVPRMHACIYGISKREDMPTSLREDDFRKQQILCVQLPCSPIWPYISLVTNDRSLSRNEQ